MRKIVLFSTITVFLAGRVFAQNPIQPTLFGQNAWFIDVLGSVPAFSTDFVGKLPDIEASGVKYMRIGGIEPNWDPLYEFDPATYDILGASKLIHLITELRLKNIEPIIQVGYNPACSGIDAYGSLANLSQFEQATIAGNLVAFINNAGTGVSPGIQYWIIGNEPDLALGSCSDPRGYGYGNQTDAGIIASYIKEFSEKMKTADNSIKIIGPELASYGNDNGSNAGVYFNPSNKIMDDLINDPSSSSSIMGMIPSLPGLYYVDVISFHYYPNITGPFARSIVIGDPSNAINGFRGNIIDDGNATNQFKGLVEMITSPVNATGRTLFGSTAIRIACTEFNLENGETAFNEADVSPGGGYSQMINGIGNRSFLGGQWMAEVFSEAMDSPWMQFMTPWSVVEDGIVPGGCYDGKGYISNCGAGNKRPTYWHYQLIAENFNGTYIPPVIEPPFVNIKAFASQQTTGGFAVINGHGSK